MPLGKGIASVAAFAGYRCLIGEGLRGVCKVRFNEGGQLRVPFGYVAALQCDPVEKKPFFHVYPGSDALTFGMLGCDYHCDFCQNWLTSQALRDPDAAAPLRPVTPEQLVELAPQRTACSGGALLQRTGSSPPSGPPLVFRVAKEAGLACAFVSNGNATPEALDFVRPWLTAYKVDLKSFDDRRYRTLGGTLEAVLRTIRMVHERGLWLEVVTLIIPGFNDSDDELRRAADFLASVSPDIPWHVTAFHKDYRMTDPDATTPATLMRACEIGRAAGLRFVYAGNLPGRVGPWEDTRCPGCGVTVIARHGYLIRSYRLTPQGRCPDCQTQLPGVWPVAAEEVRTGNDQAAYQARLPRRVAASRSSLPIVDSAVSHTPQDKTTMSSESPGLTDDQKQQVLRTAVALLRGTVSGLPIAPPPLPEHSVAGTFVSLKRSGHLRSCCGQFGAPVPLAQALPQSIQRTAWEDARFPPISPTEAAHPDLELWFLYRPGGRPRPRRRANARGHGRPAWHSGRARRGARSFPPPCGP